MTDVENRALLVPRASVGGNVNLPHATTAVTYYVPPHWKGKWISIKSATSDLYYAFGDLGVDLKASGYSAATAVGGSEPKYLVPYWNAGDVVLAGTREDVYVKPDDTYMCFVSSAASGYFYIRISDPTSEEWMPPDFQGGGPALFLDPSNYPSLTVSSGVAAIRNRYNPAWSFAEGTNKPALTAGSSETLVNGRPNAAFTAGSSHKLVCTAADCAALFGSTSAFSLFLGFSRGATAAAHTLFSVGTNGSANGRWDLTLDASDDLVITRVSSGGASTTSTYATTVTGAPTSHIFSYIYDGAGTNTAYIDRTAVALSGSATGDVGTLSKVSIGCRGYNTATYDQFATGKMTSVLAYPRALSTAEIDKVHEWYIYRLGL